MQRPIMKLEFEPALMGDNGVYMMIRKVAAIFADQTDKLLMDAIIQEAIKIGIAELYVLNKDFIISAIREKMESEEGGISLEEALWAIAFVLLWMLIFKDMSGKDELLRMQQHLTELYEIKKELKIIADRMKKEE